MAKRKVKRKPQFQVGDTVRLAGYKRTAKIERFLRDVPGRCAVLATPLGGFHFWDVNDLILVRRGQGKKGRK